MSGGVWDILGIAPTSEETTIRSAYAAVLKRVRPDEDPEGFRKLRGAYEAALRGATRQGPAQKAPAVQDPEPASAPEPRPAQAALGLEQRAAALIRERDTGAAAALLLATRGENTLPLGPWMRLADLLALRLAQDPAIPEPHVERIATDFGWYGPGAQPPTPIVKALRARIDAARWIAIVRANAAKWTRFFGNDKSAASAMLLGSGRLGLTGLLPPYSELVTLLSGLQAHGSWAARSLNGDRVARLQRLIHDTPGQQRRRIIATVATAVAFGAAGDLQATFLCTMVMMWMRIVWLRRFTVLALLLATATALAGTSGDERLARGVFYCTVALCAGYFVASIVAHAGAFGRGRWRQQSLRMLALAMIVTAWFLVANWEWKGLSPVLSGYGLNDQTGPLALIGAGIVFIFIFNRAGGGDDDSMPRW
jgi:hypothetical protein